MFGVAGKVTPSLIVTVFCMFATNFPVACLRVDYNTLVRSVKRMLHPYSADEQNKFFVGNAIRFYRLPDPASG